MPFLCKVLLAEYKFKDGETWKQVKTRPYDLVNLFDAIAWAKDYIGKPHTLNLYEVDYHDFIQWCASEIRKQIEMGYPVPIRA